MVVGVFLFLSGMPGHLFAQSYNVEWSETATKQGSLIYILPKSDNEFYALRWTGGSLFGYYKVSLHRDLQLVASGKLRLYAEQSIATFEAAKVVGGKLVVFLSDKKDGQKILFMQVYDENVEPEGEAVRLGSFDLERGGSKGWFEIKMSSNNKYLGIVWQIPAKKDEHERYGFKVYTEDLELVNEGEYPLPFDPDLSYIHSHHISNTGDYFLALTEYEIAEERTLLRDRKEFKALHIYHIAPDGLQDLVLDAQDKRVVAMAMTSDSSNIFTITGVYGEKDESGVKGVFYKKVDLTSGETMKEGFKEFDRDFITQGWTDREIDRAKRREKRGKGEPQLYHYQMRAATIMSDGSIVGTLEQYYVQVRTSYDSRTGQNTSTYYYYYNDIIVYRIGVDGEFDWLEKVPKYQVSTNDGGPFSSFESFVDNGKIYFIFNDNLRNYDDQGNFSDPDKLSVANYSRNRNVVALASLDLETGEQTRKNFFDRSTIDALAMPKKFEVNYQQGQLIMYAIWGRRKEKFGLIKFKE